MTNEDSSNASYATRDSEDILGIDSGIIVEAVAPHMATCAQCGKAAAISHVVRIFCTEEEFVEYELCYRCANQNIDVRHLMSQSARVGSAQKERVNIFWSVGKRAA